jgi:cell division FtsZ-interacting protein ZapD
MLLDSLKQEVMRHGMKLLSNPKFMKMMADPRLMNAISQAFALKGTLEREIGGRLRWIAEALHLATKEELEGLRQSLDQTQSSVNHLEKKIEHP